VFFVLVFRGFFLVSSRFVGFCWVFGLFGVGGCLLLSSFFLSVLRPWVISFSVFGCFLVWGVLFFLGFFCVCFVAGCLCVFFFFFFFAFFFFFLSRGLLCFFFFFFGFSVLVCFGFFFSFVVCFVSRPFGVLLWVWVPLGVWSPCFFFGSCV